MTLYFLTGGGVMLLACAVWLAWFSYRAGQARASIGNAQTAALEADTVAKRAQAMAQAQISAPETKEAVLSRLDGGDA